MIPGMVSNQDHAMPGIPGQVLTDRQRNRFVIVHAIEQVQTDIDASVLLRNPISTIYIECQNLKTRMRTTINRYGCIKNVTGSEITGMSIKINSECEKWI